MSRRGFPVGVDGCLGGGHLLFSFPFLACLWAVNVYSVRALLHLYASALIYPDYLSKKKEKLIIIKK